MNKRGKSFRLYIRGENACFSRPEFKVERVSYEVPTPSAMRGVLEAIYWKPCFRWVIERIDILKPIKFETIRRNELKSKASPRSKYLNIEDNRQQRQALILKDVAYIIYAHQELTDKEIEGNNLNKIESIFYRRATKGQYFHHPYLGVREFAISEFRLLEDNKSLKPIELDKELGWMLYDLDFRNPKNITPLYFNAYLKKGSIKVPHPSSKEVKR